MTTNQIKLFVLGIFTLPLLVIVIFNTNNVSAVSDPFRTDSSADNDAAATYKTKCAVCHSPKAEKSFDPAKKDDELIEIILKGKKAAKQPHMPEFESKGITKEMANDLLDHMRKLRNPEANNKNSTDAKEVAREVTDEKAREALVAFYKTNCAACHTAKAEKFYNPEMKEDEQARIILKGKKGEKPPYMPAFEAKGVTEKQANALSAYMIELRTPSK